MSIDKTLIGRHFVRGSSSTSERSKPFCLSQHSSSHEEVMSGSEARGFYESLIDDEDVVIIGESNCPTISFNADQVTNLTTCKMCGLEFLSDKDSEARHIISMTHQFALLSKNPPPPSPLVLSSSNIGYRMLSKMGWKDVNQIREVNISGSSSDSEVDKEHSTNLPLKSTSEFPSTTNSDLRQVGVCGGLGRDGRGRRHPIATVLKRDRHGLGWRILALQTDLKPYTQTSKKAFSGSNIVYRRPHLARVTHFGPRDTAAVQDPPFKTGGRKGSSRAIVLDKRLHKRLRHQERIKERQLRLAMDLTRDE
ncbi:unnamed protein product [Protopolystoma xenopodis]|uniref:G-patch domain-containing protein n=1 Tax=Protopolystoma xenopodis TaxID=117903 RepID=A0A3S5BKR7_9PLAT|nr:unnamed protein product [Protopolystoma xenopodis]